MQPEIHCQRRIIRPAQIKLQVLQIDRMQVFAGQRCHINRDDRGLTRHRMIHVAHFQRLNNHITACAETANRAINRHAFHLGSFFNHLPFTDGTGHRIELHDRHRRDRAQKIRPEQHQKRLRHFRQLIIDLFAQTPGQKGEPFQQAFNIRIGAARRQIGGQAREILRELLPGVPEVVQLILKIPCR